MENQNFQIGDRADWSDELDPDRKKQLVEDFGPGPFIIYKEAIRDSKQFVVLACKSGRQMMVLEDRDQLLFPVGDPDAEKIPARIPSYLLKKL